MPDTAGGRDFNTRIFEASQFSDAMGSEPVGGFADFGAVLAELEIIEPAEFDRIVAESQHNSARLLENLRRSGYLTPFQIRKIQEQGVRSLRFDDYALLDKLGEGGTGEVFKARNLTLGRLEAIKTIQPDGARNESVSLRFQREARVLAQLEHSAIVPIHKVGRYNNIDYIAMKFVEGKTLLKRIEESNQGGITIPVATACRWILEAADALDYAHRHNIIHRDIKPGNLMVTLNGRIVVLDMGIARLTDPIPGKDQILTVAARAMGTPEYMPPEQWADATAVSPASDVYSLGCTLVHLLTGHPPYGGKSNRDLIFAHTTAPIPKIREKRRDVPKALDEIIAKSLAKQPKDRFQSARALIEALDSIAAKLPADGRSVSSMSIDPSAIETARGVHIGPRTQPETTPFLSMPPTTSTWNIDIRKKPGISIAAVLFWTGVVIAGALTVWVLVTGR